MVQVALVRILCIANIGFLDEVLGETKVRFRFDKQLDHNTSTINFGTNNFVDLITTECVVDLD